MYVFLSRGTAWVATLGKRGKRPQHIENRLHRAAQKNPDTPVRCPVSGVSLLVKDSKKVLRQLAALRRQQSSRFAKAKAKAKAKGIAMPKRKPKKKSNLSKNAEPTPKLWPMFLPHLMLNSIYSASLIKNLMLGFWRNNVCSNYSTFSGSLIKFEV